jgi:(R)-2-hydroxyglutarate---pyruvate transhydrogenase
MRCELCDVMRYLPAGYDLKQLFIGSEGTLGVISRVSLLVPRKPKSVNVAFVGVSSFESVLRLLGKARAELGEILSAVEFQDRKALELVIKHIPNARDPLSAPAPFYMLIETSGSDREHDTAVLTDTFPVVSTRQQSLY